MRIFFLTMIAIGLANLSMAGDFNHDDALIDLSEFKTEVKNNLDNQNIAFEDVSFKDKKKLQLLSNDASIKKESDKFQKTGQADKIVMPDNKVLFPYGLSQAKLVCAKMMFSQIILQEGEVVKDLSAGDKVRWQYKVSYKGDASAFTPIVQVKPFFGNLTTNLLIVTNKRDYNVIISSIDDGDYIPLIGFYYPQEDSETFVNSQPPVAKAKQNYEPDFKVENIQFNYQITGDKKLEWYPERVFEDGNKVYIKMPQIVENTQLPILIVTNSKGEPEFINYRYRKPYFIVDTIFNQATLTLRTDKDVKNIKITKKRT